MWSDFWFALRQWRRNKALAGVIVLLLGVGIGANTLIFSFIDAVLLKPLPVRDPQNLFAVNKIRAGEWRPDIPFTSSFFYPVFKKLQARKDLFSSAIAEEEWTRSSFMPLDTGGTVKMVSTQVISPNYFSDLNVHSILGRVLLPSDANASNVPAVISYQFWHSHFNGDPNVLDRSLRLKNYSFRIVGVLPRDFHGVDVDRSPDIRLPISSVPILTGHTVFNPKPSNLLRFQVQVRLAPHVTPASVGGAVTRLARIEQAAIAHFLFRESGNRLPPAELNRIIQRRTNYRVSLQAIPRGASMERGRFFAALYASMAAVGLLLLAVCASVAGLLFARAERRRQEIAIRAAVGASRAQLLRQFFVEHLLLALPGASLGILFAYAVAPMLLHLLPKVREIVPMYATPEVIEVSLDKGVLCFTIAVAFVSVFLSGMVPALREARAGLT
ncbi:MAG: ABC transporter permease, partial [Terriglobia bacterium]